MLDTATRRVFDHYRAQGLRTSSALRLARTIVAPPTGGLEWGTSRDYTPVGTGTIDGFEVSVRVLPQYDYDASDYGTFTDTWSPEAIPTGKRNSREFAWFVPAMETTEERRRYLNGAAGMSRHTAWLTALEYARHDMRLAREPEAYCVRVTVSRQGVELGSAALYGYDVDPDTPSGHTFALLQDWAVSDSGVIEEALEEAREALGRLVRSA